MDILDTISWRNGGSSPAEKSVRNWTFVARSQKNFKKDVINLNLYSFNRKWIILKLEYHVKQNLSRQDERGCQ